MVSEHRSWCQPLHFYPLNKKSCLAKMQLARLFPRSTITVKVTRLLVLQVCLPITPLLILFLRNHGFWIAEQPITLHLLHNFSHTSSSFISNVNLPTSSTAPISSTGTIKFNDKITLKDVLCVPSFNLNLMSISKITSSFFEFYRTWLRGG